MNPDPGLDLHTLRALAAPTTRAHAVDQIGDRIAGHLDRHDGYLAFSGGKDSLVVLDLARRVCPQVPVVFFDSGLEYPETYDYIGELAHTWNLDLHVVAADPPLLDVLIASGQWAHGPTHDAPAPAVDLHEVLIGGPSRRAHEMFGAGELWGVRADESRGRRALYTRGGRRNGIIERADGTVAYGPIWNWSHHDVWAHITRDQLPINPVYPKLAALGVPEHQQRISHLIDGNHLHRGRLTWLRSGWPTLFDRLTDALPRLRQLI
ncbi:phosphoadenosine phosphosulfate reductase family protein [Rhodococcus sp. NPDC003318]|uniref:phosphoadenosine phosphosulfate reductase domain-containing protein n=1 Tax=Rhodococcus sp. NPDC003318 TaxID=3364503 RepID=UPI0036B6DA82